MPPATVPSHPESAANLAAETSAAPSASSASGTPTFFVNGKALVGAQPFSTFKPLIDEALAKK